MVRIITMTCANCGTVLAGNVLEARREMKCPGLGCQKLLKFEDLAEDDKRYMLNNSEKLQMGD
jgi:phage FluMu protein Com